MELLKSLENKTPDNYLLRSQKTDDTFSIKKSAYHDLKERAFQKINAVKKFLETKSCRSNQLLEYFDQKNQKRSLWQMRLLCFNQKKLNEEA